MATIRPNNNELQFYLINKGLLPKKKLTELTPDLFAHPQLEDDQALREKLIRWAQRMTDGYPQCNVVDLTTSWRTGLVFNAILHRNR